MEIRVQLSVPRAQRGARTHDTEMAVSRSNLWASRADELVQGIADATFARCYTDMQDTLT